MSERAGRGRHLQPVHRRTRCICSYIRDNTAAPGRSKVHRLDKASGITLRIVVCTQEFDPIFALDSRCKIWIKRVRAMRVKHVVKGIVLNVRELG